MLKGKTVAVVVPAYNEGKQIQLVLDNMPEFVDRIVVVNDKSKDHTAEIVQDYIDHDQTKTQEIPNQLAEDIEPTIYNPAEIKVQEQERKEIKFFTPHEVYNKNEDKDRIILINHLKNRGVGAAIATGYKWCKDHHIDCTAVMAGDGQMDPNELEGICRPVVEDGIDYVKGNRLIHRSAWLVIPRIRFIGNAILSIFTKIASGYWQVSDTQTGYTAISLAALRGIRIYNIYKSYGMPNDLLVKLNIIMATLKEVEIKPVYNVGEKSKMKVFSVISRISWLLIRQFFRRLWVKYLFRDFHPLFLFYNFAFLLGLYNLRYFIQVIQAIATPGFSMPSDDLIKFLFLFIASFQSLFFAMWMDIMDNERLNK